MIDLSKVENGCEFIRIITEDLDRLVRSGDVVGALMLTDLIRSRAEHVKEYIKTNR